MSELRALARGVPGAEWRRIIDVAAPAAGADVSVNVIAKKAWRLLGVSAKFVAAAAVANRNAVLTVNGADGIPLFEIPALASITTGQTRTFTWATGLGNTITGAGTALAFPLPDPCYMMPGEALTLTGVGNAADQWSNVRVVVLETNTGDVAHERNAQQAIVDHFAALTDLFQVWRP